MKLMNKDTVSVEQFNHDQAALVLAKLQTAGTRTMSLGLVTLSDGHAARSVADALVGAAVGKGHTGSLVLADSIQPGYAMRFEKREDACMAYDLCAPDGDLSNVLGCDDFRSALDALKESNDYLFVLLPPVTATKAAIIAAQALDGVAIVVQKGVTVCKDLANLIQCLCRLDVPIFGSCLVKEQG